MKTLEEYRGFIEGELGDKIFEIFALSFNTKTTRDAIEAMTKFYLQENGFEYRRVWCNEENNTPEDIDLNRGVVTITFDTPGKSAGTVTAIDLMIMKTGEINNQAFK